MDVHEQNRYAAGAGEDAVRFNSSSNRWTPRAYFIMHPRPLLQNALRLESPILHPVSNLHAPNGTLDHSKHHQSATAGVLVQASILVRGESDLSALFISSYQNTLPKIRTSPGYRTQNASTPLHDCRVENSIYPFRLRLYCFNCEHTPL